MWCEPFTERSTHPFASICLISVRLSMAYVYTLIHNGASGKAGIRGWGLGEKQGQGSRGQGSKENPRSLSLRPPRLCASQVLPYAVPCPLDPCSLASAFNPCPCRYPIVFPPTAANMEQREPLVIPSICLVFRHDLCIIFWHQAVTISNSR